MGASKRLVCLHAGMILWVVLGVAVVCIVFCVFVAVDVYSLYIDLLQYSSHC